MRDLMLRNIGQVFQYEPLLDAEISLRYTVRCLLVVY